MLSNLIAKSLILSSVLISSTFGEIKVFNGPLPATSSFVQYSSSYLVDPGYIDLTNVIFIANKVSTYYTSNDDYYGDDLTEIDDDDDGNDFILTDDMTDEEDHKNNTDATTDEPTSPPTVAATESATDSETATETVADSDSANNGMDNNDQNDLPTNDGNNMTDSETETNETFDGNSTDTPPAHNKVDNTDVEVEEGSDVSKTGTGVGHLGTPPAPGFDGKTPFTYNDGSDNPPLFPVDSGGIPDDGDNGVDVNSTDFDLFLETNSTDFLETEANDGGGRRLPMKEYTIDILFFLEPSFCAKSKDGCDWPELGVGNSDSIGNLRWCCSEDALALGLCDVSQLGRMIVNSETFKGEHRFVNVPASGDFDGTMTLPVMTTKEGTGQYTLLMGNCNDYGRDVEIDGEYIWKSKGGYLPGDLFDDMRFTIFLLICYGVLMYLYGSGMRKNRDSTIGIQKWILCTIAMGLLQTLFQAIDYLRWNSSGLRSNNFMYTWITVGVLKGSISRCLLIMVCLGWGVIRDTLGDQMKKIVILGIFYFVMAFARDTAEVVFIKDIQVLSYEKEEEIYDIFTFFALVTSTIDVVVYMWVLDSLNGTMQYLENMNQSMKLKRYLKLRLILMLSILFGFVWSVLGIVNATMDTAILNENQDWVLPAAWAMNYFAILAAIAFLWQPNPQAKEFAYVMELPSVGDDLGFETNIGTIGIDDDDDDYDGIQGSYSGGLQGDGMTIKNAVSS